MSDSSSRSSDRNNDDDDDDVVVVAAAKPGSSSSSSSTTSSSSNSGGSSSSEAASSFLARFDGLRELPLAARLGVFGVCVAAFAATNAVILPFVRAGRGRHGVPYAATPYRALATLFAREQPTPQAAAAAAAAAAAGRLRLLPTPPQRTAAAAAASSAAAASASASAAVPPTFVDLGSGTGRVALEAARQGFAAVGYEANPWLLRRARRAARREAAAVEEAGGSVEWVQGDLFEADVAGADVVYAYLPKQAVLERLHQKFEDELQPGTTVVSHGMRMPFWRTLAPPVDDLYIYRKGDKPLANEPWHEDDEEDGGGASAAAATSAAAAGGGVAQGWLEEGQEQVEGADKDEEEEEEEELEFAFEGDNWQQQQPSPTAAAAAAAASANDGDGVIDDEREDEHERAARRREAAPRS